MSSWIPHLLRLPVIWWHTSGRAEAHRKHKEEEKKRQPEIEPVTIEDISADLILPLAKGLIIGFGGSVALALLLVLLGRN